LSRAALTFTPLDTRKSAEVFASEPPIVEW
jgi:hypothetical protein